MPTGAVNIEKSSGPSTDPCGTPETTVTVIDRWQRQTAGGQRDMQPSEDVAIESEQRLSVFEQSVVIERVEGCANVIYVN